jgi:hypothetical protein
MKFKPADAAHYINSLITRKAKIDAWNWFKEKHGDAFVNAMRPKLKKAK